MILHSFLFTDEKGRFSDNFFDLIPNKTKVVEFITEVNSLDDIQIKTLNNF